ncbi:hypothetical protein [Halomicrobium salinisoli]|uniref:hypothetical protein n=1 Tax=Halomicrobium salinisoli TaxID=2878391 RepID=UPI001CF01A35|nr:hypothetical protein [Halomicrobium salinisoli]
MVSVVGLAGLLVIVLVNSAVTALLTRFFRVRLDTSWGGMLYSLLICPVAALIGLLVLSGVLGLGENLGSRGAAVALTVLLPVAIGITFDYLWMPPPEDVDLPEAAR